MAGHHVLDVAELLTPGEDAATDGSSDRDRSAPCPNDADR